MKKLFNKAVTLILLLNVAIPNTSQATCEWNAHGSPACARAPRPAAPAPSPGPTPSTPAPDVRLTTPEMDNLRALLGACDKAEKDCEKLAKTKDAKIQKQGEIMLAQDKEISELKADRDNILKNPILWAVIGIAIGVAGGVAIGNATHR